MITRPLLRALRNDLPMSFTIRQLGQKAPYAKYTEGRFRFQCPHCHETVAAVNPRNNLAHCFNCGENINNIDLLLALGYGFREAVALLQEWLRLYKTEGSDRKSKASSHPARPNREGAARIAHILRQAFEHEG